MPEIALKAHFDGQHITLDEPCNLPPGTPVTVTVVSAPEDSERADWARASATALSRAYSDDEPEYTVEDLKP